MTLGEHQRELDAVLLAFRDLWHPQPFREPLPAWCEQWPALAREIQSLPEDAVAGLNDDHQAALALLAKHLPSVAGVGKLSEVPARHRRALPTLGRHWAWEIPGRKRQQIEAFAAATVSGNRPVLDWCGGKGHLGRLLGLAWQTRVATLEIDHTLCEAGDALAARAGLNHEFIVTDALTVSDWPRAGDHAVALHACGNLHRRLIATAGRAGVECLDVAPCCYYRGVDANYQPLSRGAHLVLSRDDTRLAVTETVTAAPRQVRQRDRELAWKLGFDAYRRAVGGGGYRSFKPVPAAWMRGGFTEFLARMAQREGVPAPAAHVTPEFEAEGWQRRHAVVRQSIVRHAFRRAIEIWLVLDLANYLEDEGYAVELGTFCERRLTPRNLLISARRGS